MYISTDDENTINYNNTISMLKNHNKTKNLFLQKPKAIILVLFLKKK